MEPNKKDVIELDLSSDDDAPPSTPPRAATAGARANPPTSESDDSELQYMGTRPALPAVGANPPTAAAAQQPNNNKKTKISVKGQTPDFSNKGSVEDLVGHLSKLSTDQKKNEDWSLWYETSSSEDEALRDSKPPARPAGVPPAAAARRRTAGDESSVSSMERDEPILRQGREEESSEEEEEEEEAGRKPAAADRKPAAARVFSWELGGGEESSDDEGAPRGRRGRSMSPVPPSGRSRGPSRRGRSTSPVPPAHPSRQSVGAKIGTENVNALKEMIASIKSLPYAFEHDPQMLPHDVSAALIQHEKAKYEQTLREWKYYSPSNGVYNRKNVVDIFIRVIGTLTSNSLLLHMGVAKCRNPPTRGNASIEAGGYIDPPRQLSSIATVKGLVGFQSGMAKDGVNYRNIGNMFNHLMVNRGPDCELTVCGRHCKAWCFIFAGRMVWLTLVNIRYVCGVLRMPYLIYNVGGTGDKAYFDVLQWAVAQLPPHIRNLVMIIPKMTHVHRLYHFPHDRSALEHLRVTTEKYVIPFFELYDEFMRRISLRARVLGKTVPGPGEPLQAVINNELTPFVGRPRDLQAQEIATRRASEQCAAAGRLGGQASWAAFVARAGSEEAARRELLSRRNFGWFYLVEHLGEEGARAEMRRRAALRESRLVAELGVEGAAIERRRRARTREDRLDEELGEEGAAIERRRRAQLREDRLVADLGVEGARAERERRAALRESRLVAARGVEGARAERERRAALREERLVDDRGVEGARAERERRASLGHERAAADQGVSVRERQSKIELKKAIKKLTGDKTCPSWALIKAKCLGCGYVKIWPVKEEGKVVMMCDLCDHCTSPAPASGEGKARGLSYPSLRNGEARDRGRPIVWKAVKVLSGREKRAWIEECLSLE